MNMRTSNAGASAIDPRGLQPAPELVVIDPVAAVMPSLAVERKKRYTALRQSDPGAYAHWAILAPDDARANAGAGVYWAGIARDSNHATTGYAAPVFLCAPLEVRAKARDSSSNQWGRLLVFADDDGVAHEWICTQDRTEDNPALLVGELRLQGLRITSDHKMTCRLVEYILSVEPDARVLQVARTGWHGDAYVLPNRSVGGDPREPLMLAVKPEGGTGLGTGGTPAGWREKVAIPCVGNSRLVLAVSAALAAPCLGLVDAEGGGIHLRGPSSTGKSTAQEVAASVYGRPHDYKRMWRATDNGLEGVAALHTDALLVLDELGELDPRHAGQVAYMLANGQGKVRSHKDGTPRPVTTWRLLFLSSGEVGLADLVVLAGGKVRAGQEVRVIDLPADAGAGLGVFEHVPAGMPPDDFADALKAASAAHYGYALPAMLDAIVADADKARDTLRALSKAIAAKMLPAGAAGQVKRVANRFALIAAAGEFATASGITGWTTGEAERGARVCFDAWLGARGTAGDVETPAMLAQVRGFLNANGEARFTPWNVRDDAPRTARRCGFRKDSENGPVYYIDREAFRVEVCEGFDYHSVVSALIAAGALRTGSGVESTRKERLPDGRHTRVYVIGPELWNGGAP